MGLRNVMERLGIFGSGDAHTLELKVNQLSLLPTDLIVTTVDDATLTIGDDFTLDAAGVATINGDDVIISADDDISLTPVGDLNLKGLVFDPDRQMRVARVALGALDTAGGVLAWCPGIACLVHDVTINVTTKSTAASTIDVGFAANGTTSAANLLDELDTGTGIGTYNHVDNKGTGGGGWKTFTLSATQYITGSKASGACAGLAGYAYITYTKL